MSLDISLTVSKPIFITDEVIEVTKQYIKQKASGKEDILPTVLERINSICEDLYVQLLNKVREGESRAEFTPCLNGRAAYVDPMGFKFIVDVFVLATKVQFESAHQKGDYHFNSLSNFLPLDANFGEFTVSWKGDNRFLYNIR